MFITILGTGVSLINIKDLKTTRISRKPTKDLTNIEQMFEILENINVIKYLVIILVI